MNPLHNDEQLLDHLQSSGNDAQPTEEPTSSQPIYIAHVGPLCPVDMGKVTNSTFSLF